MLTLSYPESCFEKIGQCVGTTSSVWVYLVLVTEFRVNTRLNFFTNRWLLMAFWQWILTIVYAIAGAVVASVFVVVAVMLSHIETICLEHLLFGL